MDRRFRLVDVFGTRPLTGNPLAVVVDAEGLDADEMLDLTRWLGFSETTFLLPPESADADYRVRIFTLSGELPFAGHPTLGTCHVWAGLHGDPPEHIVQECGAGLVPLRRSGSSLSFRAPPLLRQEPIATFELADIVSILGIGLFALPAGIMASGFAEAFKDEEEEKHKTACPNCGYVS